MKIVFLRHSSIISTQLLQELSNDCLTILVSIIDVLRLAFCSNLILVFLRSHEGINPHVDISILPVAR